MESYERIGRVVQHYQHDPQPGSEVWLPSCREPEMFSWSDCDPPFPFFPGDRCLFPALVEFFSQLIQEHSIGLLPSLKAGHPEEFIGRMLKFILQAKGKNNGIRPKDLEKQCIGGDGPAHADPVRFLAVKIL